MIYQVLIFTFITIKNLQATYFDLSLINDESENLNGFPNITTLSTWSRPIGTTPASFATMSINILPTVIPFKQATSIISSNATESTVPPLKQTSELFADSTHVLEPLTTLESAVLSPSAKSLPVIESIPNPFPSPNTTVSSIISVLSPTPSVHTSRRAPKKARIEIDLEVEEYIVNEVNSYNLLKPEKFEALRKALEFIACNDYDGFCGYEPTFRAAFNHCYQFLKKGKAKVDYMMHYIIRFGATNFLNSPSYGSRFAKKESNIAEAFEYLIATKSLEVVLIFIEKAFHFSDCNVMKAISRSVQICYPDLHFLDYIVFELKLFGNRKFNFVNALNIFKAEKEEEKFYHLTKYLETAKTAIGELHFSQIRLMEIPIRYEEYFMSLDIDLKYYLAILMIINEDIKKLIRIVELSPEIILHNSNGNIFKWAVISDKPNIVQFLMEIAPELSYLGMNDFIPPVAIAIENNNLDILRVFAACGFNFLQKLQFKKLTNTALQHAFEKKLHRPFEFIINVIGEQNALDHLLKLYESRNRIMQRAMLPKPNLELIIILRDRLGFDMNSEYNYNFSTGNVLVFDKFKSICDKNFKKKLGL